MLNKDSFAQQQWHIIEDVRTQVIDTVLLLGGLLGFALLLLSLLTNDELLWQYETIAFALLTVTAAVLTLFRKHISYLVKTGLILALVYFIGVLNLVAWGLIGSSLIWLVLTVLLTVIFHDNRWRLVSYGLVFATLTIVTLLVRQDIVTFGIDFEAYASSDIAWVSQIIVIILLASVLVMATGRIMNELERQLMRFHQDSHELAKRSQSLTIEIEKREDAEMALAHLIDRYRDLDYHKDQFIDAVSHELRTPIANIQLYHQLLGMKPEKQKDYLATLKHETERLSYVVEQMIHASGDNYDMELTTMIEIDLKATVVRLFNQQNEAISKAEIELILPDTDEEFLIQASPEHIDRAVGNLVDNALKYTPRDGTVSVKMLRDDEALMRGLNIQNTGDCPSDDEKPTLFDRFVRGESALKMAVPGAGLGLPISRQIITKYGGRVDFAYDEATHSLSFTVWLPALLQVATDLADEIVLPASSNES